MHPSSWPRSLLPLLVLGACQNRGPDSPGAPPTATAAAALTPPGATAVAPPTSQPVPADSPAGPAAAGPAEAPVADPRVALAAARCGADRRAIVVRDAQVHEFAGVQEALDAAGDRSLVWLCPGVYGVESSLVVKGREDLTIAGTGAVLVAMAEIHLLSLEDSGQLTLRGLRLGHMLEDDATLIGAFRVRGLVIDGCSLDGEGSGTGLALHDTRGAVIRGARFMNLAVALAGHGADTRVSDSRFIGNAAEVDNDLARAGLDASNSFLPGRGGAGAKAPALTAAGLPDLAAAFPAERTWPIITWNGRRYAALAVDIMPETPPCTDGEGESIRCTRPMAFTGELPGGREAAAFKPLTTVTSAGPCTMTGAAPVLLDTSGCDPSYTLAVPLKGCADSAPIATTGALPDGLRWVARDPELRGTVSTEGAPPTLRPWLEERLADTLVDLSLTAGATSAVIEWTVSTGAERWTSRAAGVQFSIDECATWEPAVTDTWVETEGGPRTAVGLPPGLFREQRWIGALAANGRLAAFVVERQVSLSLLAREPDGAFSGVWEGERWRDNDECITSWGPLGFRGRCEP